MPLPLVGADPSAPILDGLSSLLGVPVGWDMPTGTGRRVRLTLSPGAMGTPVTQRMSLTVSCYADQPDGSCDWDAAAAMFRACASWVLAHAKAWPLVSAELMAGPIQQHDVELGVDYAYGSLMLDVAAITQQPS